MFRIFKKKPKYNLREEVGKYVAKHYGDEFVEEALNDYDILNSGGTIGDFSVTTAFLDMIGKVKAEIGK